MKETGKRKTKTKALKPLPNHYSCHVCDHSTNRTSSRAVKRIQRENEIAHDVAKNYEPTPDELNPLGPLLKFLRKAPKPIFTKIAPCACCAPASVGADAATHAGCGGVAGTASVEEKMRVPFYPDTVPRRWLDPVVLPHNAAAMSLSQCMATERGARNGRLARMECDQRQGARRLIRERQAMAAAEGGQRARVGCWLISD